MSIRTHRIRPLSRTPLLLLGATLLTGLAASCQGDDPSSGPAHLDISSQRIVLTPGGSATIAVSLERDGDHAEPFELAVGALPDGVTATLPDTASTVTPALVVIESSPSVEAMELSFTVEARLGDSVATEQLELSVQIPEAPGPGAEEHAPGVVGELQTVTIGGQDLTYEVINGLAITQGDIVLGPAHELSALSEADDEPRSATCNFGFNTEFTCSRWTDGVIGYNIANNWGSEANNDQMRRLIEEAIEHWEEHTGIRFVERGSGEHLQFRNGDGCSSNIGRAVITGFDTQSISLSTRCNSMGIVAHEIGHAVGLYHEQSRDDRDEWVSIDFGRVQDFRLHNFFQWGEFERDVGGYDYGSLMHYKVCDFSRNRAACLAGDLSQRTIRPLRTVPADVEIGQRDGLSEGDILGVYTLYPPEYSIQGAGDGETGDEFQLYAAFETPSSETSRARIVWTSSRAVEPLGTGSTIDLTASDAPNGDQVITASFMVAGVAVVSRSIDLTIDNDPPSVTLTANNGSVEQQLGHSVTVNATVSDDHDGTCPTWACTYTWDPPPTSGPDGEPVAHFVFDTEGPHAVQLSVEDSQGAVGVDTLEFEAVNSAPTATILTPATDISVPEGVDLPLEGIGENINNSETGTVACSGLQWTSSDPSDVFSPSASGCTPTIAFGGVGLRTLSLVATDPEGASSEADHVEVRVTACAGNCTPTAFITVTSPDVSLPPDDDPGYFIEWEMGIGIDVAEADAPEDNPIHYTVAARRVGFVATTPIAEGDIVVPDGMTPAHVDLTWTPNDDMGQWANCTVDYREYELVVVVEDSQGATSGEFTYPLWLGCAFI